MSKCNRSLLYIIPIILLLTGCNKTSPEAKSLASAAAASAKERAAAFNAIKDTIRSTIETNNTTIQRWVAAHSAGLAAEATGLQNIVDTFQTGQDLSKNAKQALLDEATTAKSRADNLKAILPSITGPDTTMQFLAQHQNALNTLADTLNRAASLISPSTDPTLKGGN